MIERALLLSKHAIDSQTFRAETRTFIMLLYSAHPNCAISHPCIDTGHRRRWKGGVSGIITCEGLLLACLLIACQDTLIESQCWGVGETEREL